MAVFTLTPAPPFRLDLTVWVLRRLPINQMDRWDGKTYRRVLMLNDKPVEVALLQAGSARAPQLTALLLPALETSSPPRTARANFHAGLTDHVP